MSNIGNFNTNERLQVSKIPLDLKYFKLSFDFCHQVIHFQWGFVRKKKKQTSVFPVNLSTQSNSVRGWECLLMLNWSINSDKIFRNYIIQDSPLASSDRLIKCVNKAACVVFDVWGIRVTIAMIKLSLVCRIVICNVEAIYPSLIYCSSQGRMVSIL